jgi:plastocyanin
MRKSIVILCALLCVFFTFGCIGNNNTPVNNTTPVPTPVVYTQTSTPVAPSPAPNPADSSTVPKVAIPTNQTPIHAPINQSVITEVNRTSHNVTISSNVLAPTQITIASGDIVVWTNNDPTAHIIVGSVFNNTIAPNGGTARHIFIVPGTYNYVCTDQPAMKGTIIVQ